MGQKINPTGLRVGVIKDWESRWYAKNADFGDMLVEDYNLREWLLTKLAPAGVPKIEIERDANRVRINIHCAKPGMVIGRGGSEIDKLKAECEKKLGKDVSLNIVEIKSPDLNAQLVAESIASQLERRISLPPRPQAGHRPHNEAWCEGHQNAGFRPFGRRRYRPYGALS